MLSLPNLISLCRIPLAFCFLQDNPYYRTLALLIALITDGLDGYLARRFQQTSRLGTIIDPLTDKFFVIFVGIILIQEGSLSPLQALMLISRDFSVVLFGCYLVLMGRFAQYKCRAIFFGKLTTVLQLIVLLCLIWNIELPNYVYFVFVGLGSMALVELALTEEYQAHTD